MKIEGTGPKAELPLSDKPEIKQKTTFKSRFVSLKNLGNKLIKSSQSPDSTPSSLSGKSISPSSGKPLSKPETFEQKLARLEIHTTITEKDSNVDLAELYQNLQQTLTARPESSESAPSVSKQFEKDQHRIQTLALEADNTDGQREKTSGGQQRLLPLLQETIGHYDLSKEEKDALLCQLTELCSQTPFNLMLALFQTHSLQALNNEYATFFPQESAIRLCELSRTENKIHAELALKIPQITFVPYEGDGSPVTLDIPVTILVAVRIPVKAPEESTVTGCVLDITPPTESDNKA